MSWQEKDIRPLSELIDKGTNFNVLINRFGDIEAFINGEEINMDYRVRRFIANNMNFNTGKLSDITFKKLAFCCRVKSLRKVLPNGAYSEWKDVLCLGVLDNIIIRTDDSEYLKDITFEQKQQWLEEMKQYIDLPRPVFHRPTIRQKHNQDIDDARRESWWALTEGDEDLSWDL